MGPGAPTTLLLVLEDRDSQRETEREREEQPPGGPRPTAIRSAATLSLGPPEKKDERERRTNGGAEKEGERERGHLSRERARASPRARVASRQASRGTHSQFEPVLGKRHSLSLTRGVRAHTLLHTGREVEIYLYTHQRDSKKRLHTKLSTWGSVQLSSVSRVADRAVHL